MARKNGRPRGTYGPIALALLEVAEVPGTVTELALRAKVGIAAAHVTACRLRRQGDLVPVDPAQRPAVLQRRQANATAPQDDLNAALRAWHRSPGPAGADACNAAGLGERMGAS